MFPNHTRVWEAGEAKINDMWVSKKSSEIIHLRMKRKLIIPFVLLTMVTISHLSAQPSQALYFMNLPQRNTLNPALQSSSRVYVGLPFISDISLRVDNNFLSLSGLFSNGAISDSTFTILEPGQELDRFLAGLGNNNSIESQAAIQLFGLAFTVGEDLRITFDINERTDGNFVLPVDLIRLGIEGNESFLGKNIDLSSLRADMKYWHEIGIGASKNVTDKLRVGARLLILSGVASGYLSNNGITLRVNDDYTHTLDADVSLNVSAPVTFIKEDDGIIHDVQFQDENFGETNDVISYISAMANPGLGFEAGAEYRFNDLFAVSASVTDFGFISWKRDRSEIVARTTIEFNGLTLQDVYSENVTFGELLNWTLDSIQNSIELLEVPANYTTSLPFTATAGFSFTPVKFFTAGVLSQTRFKGKQLHEALTFSGNLNFGNIFSTTLAYTVANRRYDNLGFGLAVRGGVVQFFALVDNIPLRWTKVSNGEETYRLPERWNTVHAQLGMSLVFGNRERERILPPM